MRGFAAILMVLPLSVHAGNDAGSALSDGTSLRMDEVFIRHIPLNSRGADRAFEELAELAPGVQREPYGISIHGASSAENDYRVDGLSTRDPAAAINDSPLSIEFLDEVSVITSGYLPEHGRTQGALISAVTRTGSNELRGSIFVHWVPGSLDGQREPLPDDDSVVVSSSQMKNLGDLGATLGGPILKDKLWFFAGFAPSFSRTTYVRELKGLPGPRDAYFFDARSLQYLAKLTYRPVENHDVSVSLFSTPFRRGVSGPLKGDRPGSIGQILQTETTGSTPAVGLTYVGAFLDKRFLLEAHAGWFHDDASTQLKPDDGEGMDPSDPCSGDLSVSSPADRYQANVKATYLFNALGAHVIKAGADAEFLRSGQERLITDIFSTECPTVQRLDSRSNTVGGFLQDSWTLASWVTLNLGVRYDVQTLYSRTGERALSLGNQLSPRAGAEVDLLGNGRAKVFAHFARYYEQIPLYWIDRYWIGRVFSGDPRPGPAPPGLVDPELRPQSSTEAMAGADYEILSNTRLGGYYLHRNLDSAVEDISIDGGITFFLGNPGSGMARFLPKPVRTYDAATMYLSHAFADGWLAQGSYTWSRLYGNYLGLLRRDTEQLHSNISSDFDDNGFMANGVGLLPLDRTHSLKLSGAKEFTLSRQLSTSVGVSYRGNSGTPINYYGAHPENGADGVLLLQRGTGGRTPWINTLDSHFGVSYRTGEDQTVSLTLDVFNLFNFQAATRVDESYTYERVYPLESGAPADLPGKAVINTGDRVEDHSNPLSLSQEDVRSAFGQPVQRQSPRRVRFGIRYTF